MLSKEKIIKRIIEFVRQGGSCLFAGAGVAKRAGYPAWDEYINHLCNIAGMYEKDMETLMRKRLKAGFYLEAAELYKTAIEIPEGVKFAELASPFLNAKNYFPNKLHALMALPFSAVVTTNYDRSLHDAYFNLYSNRKESGLSLNAPKYVELGDLSMKQAIFWIDFYIARIHGRAEIPQTIVLDRNDYLKTQQDPFYQDFLLHILKNYHCLFLGYSFVDPAINRVLDLMRIALPHPYLKLHLAALPNDCEDKLRYELARYNIETIEYDSKNNYEALWESIRAAQHEIRTVPRKAPDKVEPIKGLSKFLASCYSRLKLGSKAEPLREIVTEGIVTQIIADSGSKGVSKEALIRSVKNYISLTDSQLEDLIRRTTERLVIKKVCNQENDIFKCQEVDEKIFDIALEKLVDSTANRLKVREGVEFDQRMRVSIKVLLNKLFLLRGWDLGAHFAGGHSSSTFDAWPQIQQLIGGLAKDVAPDKAKALANAIFDLLRHPEDQESELLADIGRIAFAVEIILKSARYTLQLSFIPESIYVDANVVMPAIVEGHPYSSVYADAISRMNSAANTVGETMRVFTAKGFLNEIINHRNLAIREVQEQGLEDIDRLRHQMLLFGTENINVYIGAYGSYIGRTGKPIAFGEFLRKVAPYNIEKELEIYLSKLGIETRELSFTSEEDRIIYNEVKKSLNAAYEELHETYPFYKGKPQVLIDHEAAQLTRLILDIEAGRKPIFVTADRRLMGLCKGEVLGRCANAIISQMGFVQLVDLILGIDTDKRALGRLFWSIELSSDQIMVRNYLIDLALQHYNEAQAMAMWEVVDQISEDAAKAAEREKIVLFAGREENRARLAAFLDRFEQDFFKKMAEVIRKREI